MEFLRNFNKKEKKVIQNSHATLPAAFAAFELNDSFDSQEY